MAINLFSVPVEDRWQINPAEFAFLHLGLQLYPWQIECLMAIAQQKPVSVAAANESGKTTFLVAPAVLYILYRFPQAQVIITSGAFRQVSHQLWPAMKKFSHLMPPDWEWNNAEIKTPDGGFALGFTVTDAGRFEGWHPKENANTDPVFIVVDEAKTVGEEIFQAIDRCGAQFQLFVSSPGAPAGQFYRTFKKERELFWTKRIRSVDCPHISPKKRERDAKKYGVDHPVYLSMHEAQFPEDDGNLVFAIGRMEHALANQPQINVFGEKVAFMDFAAGGDEWIVAGRFGNKVRILDAFITADTGVSIARSIRVLRSHGFNPGEVWGDVSGLGKPICDRFKDEYDFPVLEFNGGAAAPDEEKSHYANLISYVWEKGTRMIGSCKINLGELDAKSIEQITERPWNDVGGWNKNGKLQVMPKDKMKKELGIPSPDRGDALLGCIVCGSGMSGSVSANTLAKARIVTSPFAVETISFD
tara:strand:- start:3265 stop:4683 length:1419 start_codon:yes stop_codon:yes gene_type:complete